MAMEIGSLKDLQKRTAEHVGAKKKRRPSLLQRAARSVYDSVREHGLAGALQNAQNRAGWMMDDLRGSSAAQLLRSAGQRAGESNRDFVRAAENLKLQQGIDRGFARLGNMRDDPRVVAQRRIGRQNSLLQDPMQYPLRNAQGFIEPLDAPAANAYRTAKNTTAAYALNPAYAGDRRLNRGNSLGLARIPTIEGGDLSRLQYTGAPGSSPFVSDGPLSENRGRVIHGSTLRRALRETAREYGIGGNESVVTPGGSEAYANDNGTVRFVGPMGQLYGRAAARERLQEQHPNVMFDNRALDDRMVSERERISSGIPTSSAYTGGKQYLRTGGTRNISPDDGVMGVVARDQYQQPQLNQRLRRTRQAYANRHGLAYDPSEGTPDNPGTSIGDMYSDVLERNRNPRNGEPTAPITDPNVQPPIEPIGEDDLATQMEHVLNTASTPEQAKQMLAEMGIPDQLARQWALDNAPGAGTAMLDTARYFATLPGNFDAEEKRFTEKYNRWKRLKDALFPEGE